VSSEIGIVGGGIGGLASAYRLARSGHRVTLFEASDQLGGLGTFFDYHGRSLERFYHCMLPSDSHLLGLLEDVGLTKELYWKRTSFGFMTGGRLYPLNGALELLGFSPLSIFDRLRVGVTGLWGKLCSSSGLDDISCVEWLTRLSGENAFHKFWRPMLQAKFGDRYQQIPALWFWRRMNREKGKGPERKGYIRGGYRRIIEGLADAIRANGGEIRLSHPVTRIDLDDSGRPYVASATGEARSFDQILLTAPTVVLKNAARGGRLEQVVARADAGIDLQGVVNGVFFLRRGLTPHYWVATMDADIPFQGIVESTTLLEPEDAADLHLVYVMNYTHRTDPLFSRTDEEILQGYQDGLQKLFPGLKPEDVVDKFLFRTPFVEPLYTLGYSRRKPPLTLLEGKVFLATTSQVYPDVTSWNGAVGVANLAVAAMEGQDHR
jgi:protoporphyrinogen oxidase